MAQQLLGLARGFRRLVARNGIPYALILIGHNVNFGKARSMLEQGLHVLLRPGLRDLFNVEHAVLVPILLRQVLLLAVLLTLAFVLKDAHVELETA